jgi:hypothetical protein
VKYRHILYITTLLLGACGLPTSFPAADLEAQMARIDAKIASLTDS